MEAFIQRIVEEKQELDDRLSKLTIFSESEKFKELDDNMQDLMCKQAYSMSTYSYYLGERLKLLMK